MPEEYYYAKDGQQHGPVPVEKIQHLLQTGRIAPTDLVWAEGQSDWKPAAEVLQPAVSTPSTSPASAAQSPPSSMAPAAARASRFLQLVRRAGLWLLANGRDTAVATGRHVAQLCTCGWARRRVWQAQREALENRVTLGQKMYESGLGDAANRQLIEQISTRIRNLKAAGNSSRAVEQELRAAFAATAEPVLDGNVPPAGLTSEFELARISCNVLKTNQLAAASDSGALSRMHKQNALRIGLGYACLVLVLSSIVWASRGAGTWAPPANDPNQNQQNVENNAPDIADGGGGFNKPSDPPLVTIPTDGNVTQTSLCLNCNGTGQSDCQSCFGAGKRTCFNCNGSGRTPNNMQCFQCNGTGRQNCSFCTYGKVQCPQCFGRGQK